MQATEEYPAEAFRLSDEDKKVNAFNSAYYALVFIVIGLPIWFITTSCYRAPLPTIAPERQLRYDFEVTIIYCNQYLDTNVPSKVEALLQKFMDEAYSQSALCADEQSVCMFMNTIVHSKTCTPAEYNSLVASRKLVKFGSELEAMHGKVRPGALRVSVLPNDAFEDVNDTQAVLSRNGELYVLERSNSHYAIAALIRNALREHVLPPGDSLQRSYVPNSAPVSVQASTGQLISKASNEVQGPVDSVAKSASRFKLEFTLVGLRESEYRIGWSRFTRSARTYFDPFRNELARLGVDLRLRSSVLHDAALTINAEERRVGVNATSRIFVMRTGAQISALVNSLERYLTQYEADASVTGERRATRTLHFVVIVPPRSFSPLYFELPVASAHQFAAEPDVPAGCTASVRIAKWGSVQMLNDADLIKSVLETISGDHVAKHPLLELDNSELRLVFESALTHLRVLLGIQPGEHLQSSQNAADQFSVVVEQPDETNALRRFELGRWLAQRTVECYADAMNTLIALETLLTRIQNMVIRDAIANRVHLAVQELDNAAAALKSTQEQSEEESTYRYASPRIDAAFRSAQKALEYAEAAFFDETLLELLYFPEDQKFAIYVPLFLPVGLPVLMTLREVFAFLKRRKQASNSNTENTVQQPAPTQ